MIQGNICAFTHLIKHQTQMQQLKWKVRFFLEQGNQMKHLFTGSEKCPVILSWEYWKICRMLSTCRGKEGRGNCLPKTVKRVIVDKDAWIQPVQWWWHRKYLRLLSLLALLRLQSSKMDRQCTCSPKYAENKVYKETYENQVLWLFYGFKRTGNTDCFCIITFPIWLL